MPSNRAAVGGQRWTGSKVPGPPLNLRSFTYATERLGQGRQRARLSQLIPWHRNTPPHRHLHSTVEVKELKVWSDAHRWNVLTVAHPLQEVLEGLSQFAGLEKKHIWFATGNTDGGFVFTTGPSMNVDCDQAGLLPASAEAVRQSRPSRVKEKRMSLHSLINY